MKFINLTPHPLTIEGIGTLPPSGKVARVETKTVHVDTIDGVRVSETVRGLVTGMPYPTEGVAYIVSGMVLDSVRSYRTDAYGPDTGPDAVRNAEGHIISVKGLLK